MKKTFVVVGFSMIVGWLLGQTLIKVVRAQQQHSPTVLGAGPVHYRPQPGTGPYHGYLECDGVNYAGPGYLGIIATYHVKTGISQNIPEIGEGRNFDVIAQVSDATGNLIYDWQKIGQGWEPTGVHDWDQDYGVMYGPLPPGEYSVSVIAHNPARKPRNGGLAEMGNHSNVRIVVH